MEKHAVLLYGPSGVIKEQLGETKLERQDPVRHRLGATMRNSASTHSATVTGGI